MTPVSTETPVNTPAPAAPAATTAAVAQSESVVTQVAIETPTPQTPTAPANPFDPDYIQSRVDAFLKTQKKDAATPAAETPAAPVAEPAKPDAAPAVPAPAATPEVPAAKPDAPAVEATPATPAADAPAADSAIIVELPPRNPNGEALRIAAPDQATADAISRLKNGYMRGEEYRRRTAEVEAQAERLREVEIMLSADPLGLVDRVPEQQRLAITRALLAEHFDALRPDIEAWWNDESQRRFARAESKEKRGDARTVADRERSVAVQVREVTNAVATLIPETADEADAMEFKQDALMYLARIADSRDSGVVRADEVPQLLAKRLQRYGFTTTAPAAPVAAVPVSTPAPGVPVVTPPASVPKQPDAVRVHAINEKRAAAAATTTVGAGASPATALPKPPKGLTIEETADWYLKLHQAKSA